MAESKGILSEDAQKRITNFWREIWISTNGRGRWGNEVVECVLLCFWGLKVYIRFGAAREVQILRQVLNVKASKLIK